jgi:hypothetical protein
MGTANHNYEFVKWIPRTNEAAELMFCPLILLNSILGSNARRLFGPGSTPTSSPKLEPTPLILSRSIPPCMGGWFFLIKVQGGLVPSKTHFDQP